MTSNFIDSSKYDDNQSQNENVSSLTNNINDIPMNQKNIDQTNLSSIKNVTSPVKSHSSKFSAFVRIFKPWKWRRKKKSENFEKTSKGLIAFICFIVLLILFI